eukprot:IDg1933t1
MPVLTQAILQFDKRLNLLLERRMRRMLRKISSTVPVKSPRRSGFSVLATISRGQSRAHEALQKELVAAFYTYCPQQCAFSPRFRSTEEEKREYASAMDKTKLHRSSPDFFDAWFRACLVAQTKARVAAVCTDQDILDVRPHATLTTIWLEDEEYASKETIDMSVCG